MWTLGGPQQQSVEPCPLRRSEGRLGLGGAGLVEEVPALGLEQARLEGWVMKGVQAGAKLPGLDPINGEHRARDEAETKKGG